jgi:hypothetical protein
MKQRKIRKTITLDPSTFLTFKNRCLQERRPVSTMIDSMMKYYNQSLITSEKILSLKI